MKTIAWMLMLVAALALAGCDTPAENATEEKVEDAGEKQGQSEDAAEQQGEAVKDGATDTVGTSGTTVTTETVTTNTSGT